MNVRKKVGHEPLINVGSTVLVFNQKKELLLNLRSDFLCWGIPGGGKELRETLEECAIRELKEETNIDVNNLEFITVLSGPEYFVKYPNDDEIDCVIAVYKTENYSGDLKINDDESLKLSFFPLDNLPPLDNNAKNIIDKIKNGEIKL